MTLGHKYIHHVEWTLLEKFSRSSVKGQGHSETKRTFAAEALHFNSVTSRLTVLVAVRLLCVCVCAVARMGLNPIWKSKR